MGGSTGRSFRLCSGAATNVRGVAAALAAAQSGISLREGAGISGASRQPAREAGRGTSPAAPEIERIADGNLSLLRSRPLSGIDLRSDSRQVSEYDAERAY